MDLASFFDGSAEVGRKKNFTLKVEVEMVVAELKLYAQGEVGQQRCWDLLVTASALVEKKDRAL